MMQLDLGFDRLSHEPALTYIGSKDRLYPYVLSWLPSDVTELVSPFHGGCSLESKLAASGIRVFASDVFRPYPEFMTVFNGRSGEVVERALLKNPLSKSDFNTYRTYWATLPCEVERAAITWLITKQSFMGKGFAVKHCNAGVSDAYLLSPEWQDWRNGNLTCEVLDYREALQKYPDTWIYADPPYLGKEGYYGDGKQGRFNHRELRDILAARGKFILSYGDSPDIRDLYRDFRIVVSEWEFKHGQSRQNGKKDCELTILSPECRLGFF